MAKTTKKRKKIFNHDDSVKFLLAEQKYACFDAQHHTNIQLSAMKYAFSFYTAFLAIVIALYEHYIETIILQLAVLLAIGFFIGFVLLMFMVRNRVNYVRAVKQSTRLRNFFLKNMEIDFRKYNCLYYKPEKVKYFKKFSLYTFSMLALIIFNTLLAMGSFVMLCKFILQCRINDINLLFIILVGIFIFVFQGYIALSYFKYKQKQ